MDIGYQYILVVILGLACIAWGMPTAHRMKPPFDIAAAILVLCGVIFFVLGILLTFIPTFFQVPR